MKSSSMLNGRGCFPILAVLIGLIALIWFGITSLNTHIRTITIDSKERQCDSGETIVCQYVVFSKEGDIYTNTDNAFRLKWDSGSLQAKLHVGQAYTVKTTGFRIPFLSMKENIIAIVPRDEVPHDGL